ncbi:MAG: GDSL-type esterase/lipase family protein [Solirubrobacterales bacterium]
MTRATRRSPAARLVPLILACLLAGCGSGEPTDTGATSTATAAAGGGPRLIAVLGDSITAGSPLWDPDPGIRAQIGPALDERSQFEYWATQADPSVEFRNCGVFGERTDQIALRLDDCASGADALIIQGGINDIAQGRGAAFAAANIDSMVHRGVELGVPVAVTDVLPWNNGHPQADAPIADLNRAIAKIAGAQNVEALPFHDTLEDPKRAGTMRADLTIDGDHPSIAGYRLLATNALADFVGGVSARDASP